MSEDIDQRAAEWHAAQDSDAMDWDGFTLWLEADSRHRVAFDRVALLDDDIVAQRVDILTLRETLTEAPADRAGTRWRWRAIAGSAVAAALALIVARPHSAQDVAWQSTTSVRTIALVDGTKVSLAPGSRLVAEHGNQFQLALTGAAYFDVPHRSGRTLSIRAGGYRINDIGTLFNVAVDGTTTRIAVADGHLAVTAPGLATPITLVQGHGLLAQEGAITLSSIGTDTVDSWRRGQLVYADMPLSLVAADLGRYGGQETTVDPAIANLRFSGALKIGDGANPAEALAAIVGVTAKHHGDRIRLERRD